MVKRKTQNTKSDRDKSLKSGTGFGFSDKNFRDIFIIIIAGIVLRILYDVQLAANPLLVNYFLDSVVLHSWAIDIINGRTADLAFFRAPLYPYVLALFFKLFGISHWSIVIIQNILGILTSLITYSLAKLLFNNKIAFWSGLVVAIFPTLIYFEGEIMITSLSVFLYTLSFFLLSRALNNPTIKNIFLAGLVFGFSAISRPTILPLIIVFPITYILIYKFKEIKPCLINSMIFGFAVLIPILPVTFTNLVKGGELVLISTQGGVNFYIGNNREADGISVISPGPNLRMGVYEDNIWTASIDEAERRTGQKMSQSEISDFWFKEGLNEIRSDVTRFIGLYLKKLYLFWHGQEIFNNKPLYFAGEYSWLMKSLIWKNIINFPSGIIIPFMFLGIFLAWRHNQYSKAAIMVLVIFTFIMALFFVCARFRQPVMPLSIMFAVYAVDRIITFFKEDRTKMVVVLSISIILTVIFNWGGDVESKDNLSQFNAVLGSVYLDKNDYEQAITYLEKSIEYQPKNFQIYEILGKTYLQTWQYENAKIVYQKGVYLYPEYTLFNYGLGEVAKSEKDYQKAKEYYHRCVNNSPKYAPAYEGLARVFEVEYQIDSSIFYYEKIIKLSGRNDRIERKINELKKYFFNK